jgi:hypothetical protein
LEKKAQRKKKDGRSEKDGIVGRGIGGAERKRQRMKIERRRKNLQAKKIDLIR